jgi:hypothetical protein
MECRQASNDQLAWIWQSTRQTHSTDLSHVLNHISYIDGSKPRPTWLHHNLRKFQYLYTNNVLELLSAHAVPFQILNLHRPEPLLVTLSVTTCGQQKRIVPSVDNWLWTAKAIDQPIGNSPSHMTFWRPLRPSEDSWIGVYGHAEFLTFDSRNRPMSFLPLAASPYASVSSM